MNSIMLFVIVVFVAGVFGAYFLANYRLDKKLLAPIGVKLDKALLTEAEKSITQARNRKGGLVEAFFPTLAFGAALAILKDAGWLPVLDQGQAVFVAPLGILVIGCWYAYQQHVILNAYHEHIAKAIAWDALAKANGTVKLLHYENGAPLVVSIVSGADVLEFAVPQGVGDEVARDLMIGADVTICHQPGGNRAEHIVVTKLPEEEERRRLIEEMRSMSDI